MEDDSGEKKDFIDSELDIDSKPIKPLDDDDIALLKSYGVGPYSNPIKQLEKDIQQLTKAIDELKGIKE